MTKEPDEKKEHEVLKKLTKECEGWEIIEFSSSAFPNAMCLRMKKKRKFKTVVIQMKDFDVEIKMVFPTEETKKKGKK